MSRDRGAGTKSKPKPKTPPKRRVLRVEVPEPEQAEQPELDGDDDDQGAGFFGPSDKAKALVANLEGRWALLMAWGLKAKVKEAHLFWEDWEDFHQKWMRGDDDVTRLAAQTANLNAAEGYARDHGMPGAKLPPVQGIDIVEARDALKAAADVDQAAKQAEQLAADAAKAGANALATGASHLPWWVWVGVVGGLIGGAYVIKPRIVVQK